MLPDPPPEMRVNPFLEGLFRRLPRLRPRRQHLVTVAGSNVLGLDESLNALLNHLFGQPVRIGLEWISGVYALGENPRVPLNQMDILSEELED